MDALDQLAATAADLLTRVDATMARCGAPEDHPVWPLLRRLGALPGEAVAALAELRGDPLVAAGEPLRALAEEYAQERTAVPSELAWRGAGAESFGRRWATLSAHLAGGAETMAGRLDATAAYLAAVADWLAAARDLVARALVQALTSTEAVLLRTAAPTDESTRLALAAADLAACVLGALVEAYDRGGELLTGWAGRLAELPSPVTAADAPAWSQPTTQVTP